MADASPFRKEQRFMKNAAPLGIIKLGLATSLLAFGLLLQSCTYMGQRGNDVLDIFDIGFTVTDKAQPDLALYFDFFNMVPIGFAKVDGKLLGLGHRQFGWLDYHARHWGLLAYGSEMQGIGTFNPNDPRQARQDGLPKEAWPTHDAGFVRVFTGDNPPPRMHHIECTRQLHLGWLGFLMNIRPVEMVDFLVGWTTADILMDDDIAPVEAATRPE
jgi:hypothetical protein